jgi:hypothetical protein
MVQGAQLPVSHEHFGFEGLLAKPLRSQLWIAEDRAPPAPGAREVDLDRVAEHLLYEIAEVRRRELPAEAVAVALHDASRDFRRRRGLLRREKQPPAPSPTPTEYQQPSRSPGERAPEGRQGHGRHALFTNADRLTRDTRRYLRRYRRSFGRSGPC